MAIYNESIVDIELTGGNIFRSFLSHTIGSGDVLANRFGVRVFRNGEPENIGGTCVGYFVRADGATVVIAGGTVSGNVAYVTLPETCYAVEGQFTLAIKCTGGGVTGTLRIVDGVVSRTSTNAAVDSGEIIPSVEALIDAIDEAVAAIPADYSELQEDVKTVNGENIANTVPWAVGGIADGVDTNYNNRRKSDYIPIDEYEKIVFSAGTGFMHGCALYDSEKVYIGYLSFTSSARTFSVFGSGAAYIRMFIRNDENTNMANSDIRQVKAIAYRKTATETDYNSKTIRNIRNAAEDIEIGSWTIGYIYGDGGIDITAQPNYACTMCVQEFPEDVYITPDAGYQFMIRTFSNAFAVLTSTEWMTDTYCVPAGTKFSINLSKTTPEAVGDHLADYVAAIHFRTKAVYTITSPAANKKTKIAVLGDSISTYDGWIESGYISAYYPTGDVTSVEQMWWKIIANELGVTDITISAISRSAFYDYEEATYPPVYDSGRITRIGSGGAPDIVFVCAGTNDGFVSQSATIQYTADITTLESLPNSTVKGIALTIRRIQAAYPSAKIVMLIPKQVKISDMQTGYDLERVGKIADEIKAYAEMYGAWKVIDLRKCGINQDNVAQFCTDGIIHPNAKGMREMARYILECIR